MIKADLKLSRLKHRHIFLLLFAFYVNASFSQSAYFYKSSQTLEQEKSNAVNSGNESKKAEIEKEQDRRNAEKKAIELLNAELNQKIQTEDYLEAQTIKEKIDALKSDQEKAEQIRKKIEAAIVAEDYENAEQYKNELLKIKPTNIKQETEKSTALNTDSNVQTAPATKQEEGNNVKEELARVEAALKAAQEESERLKKIEADRIKQEETARVEAQRIAEQKAQEEARRIAEEKEREFLLYGFTLYDDFSNNTNNWPEESYHNRRSMIADGKMILEGMSENSSYRTEINIPLNTEKDFSAEANARWIRGEKNNGYGIDFASDYEGNKYYSFQVAAIGYYSVLYYENNTWHDIIPWTSNKNIKQGNETNNLKVIKESNQLLFYANEVLLNKIPWKGGYGKDFGFRIFDTQLVEFDDFKVRAMKE